MKRNSEGGRHDAISQKGVYSKKGENKILNSAKERMQDKVPKQPLITRM
jgi:hypothetical protein